MQQRKESVILLHAPAAWLALGWDSVSNMAIMKNETNKEEWIQAAAGVTTFLNALGLQTQYLLKQLGKNIWLLIGGGQSALPEKVEKFTFVDNPTCETMIWQQDSTGEVQCSIVLVTKQKIYPYATHGNTWTLILICFTDWP